MRSSGVAGFFEDIPVLILVTLGISMFLFSSAHAFTNYLQHQSQQDLQDDAVRFAHSLRSYDRLIEDKTPGVFSQERIERLNTSQLTKGFPPDHLAFEYQVTILEMREKPEDGLASYTWLTSPIPKGKDRAIVQSYVLIEDASGAHPARLSVLVWR